jgi:hypothetical protein
MRELIHAFYFIFVVTSNNNTKKNTLNTFHTQQMYFLITGLQVYSTQFLILGLGLDLAPSYAIGALVLASAPVLGVWCGTSFVTSLLNKWGG